MSDTNPDPSSSTRFSNLRTSEPRVGEPRAEFGYLAAETEKLESLKQALFVAFQDAPRAGIPAGLVDLVAAYTSALRLQLNLMGYRALPQRTKATVHPHGRARAP